MTVDISALAWMVRRMDVSATVKSFFAVFVIFVVLVYLSALYGFTSKLLHYLFHFLDSENLGVVFSVILTAVISTLAPLTFIIWDWVARKPWRHLAALNGALLGSIAMALVGGAIGFSFGLDG